MFVLSCILSNSYVDQRLFLSCQVAITIVYNLKSVDALYVTWHDPRNPAITCEPRTCNCAYVHQLKVLSKKWYVQFYDSHLKPSC